MKLKSYIYYSNQTNKTHFRKLKIFSQLKSSFFKMKLLFSQSCTRKHVPEKKTRKSKKRVITKDYRGFN